MASLDELITKLKEIFQTDRADLDFGIYLIPRAIFAGKTRHKCDVEKLQL